jgi:biopolymer transport protein ExbB/TolQ
MQNYRNHVRYYAPHHFIFYPVIVALIIISGSFISRYPEDKLIWIAIMIGFIMIMWTAYMMRQHYALTVQNRIVRLEMRFRYYRLTNTAFEPLEEKFSFGQIAALRFAADEELVELIQRALKENLSSSEIKKSIKNWQPDHMRV